jgi:serine/threonine protein phosphatase PrpC
MHDHGVLAVLADGMGGLADSERVSVTAVETILDRFSLDQGSGEPKVLLLQLLAAARQEVNRVLGAADLGKSGSTLVMGLIRGNLLYYLAVGDSRIYLLRDGALLQLSREHIYENELALIAVNGGHCEVQDAFSNPQRGALTSFLGMERLMGIDIPAAPVRLRPGDKVILMTDGVFNALEEDVLLAQLLRTPEEAVEGLRSAIEARGYTNQDNYTAIILECRDDEPQQDSAKYYSGK